MKLLRLTFLLIFSFLVEISFSQVKDYEILLTKDFLPNCKNAVIMASDSYGSIIWYEAIPDGFRTEDLVYNFQTYSPSPILLTIVGKVNSDIKRIFYDHGLFIRFFYNIESLTIIESENKMDLGERKNPQNCKIRIQGIDDLDEIYLYNGPSKQYFSKKLSKGELVLRFEYYQGEDVFVTILANNSPNPRYLYLKSNDIIEEHECNYSSLPSDLALIEFPIPEPGEGSLKICFTNSETGNDFGNFQEESGYFDISVPFYLPESFERNYCYKYYHQVQDDRFIRRTNFYCYQGYNPELIKAIDPKDFEIHNILRTKNQLSFELNNNDIEITVIGHFLLNYGDPMLGFSMKIEKTKDVRLFFPDFTYFMGTKFEYLKQIKSPRSYDFRIEESSDGIVKGIYYHGLK
jgi:hypothetical protein